jgi:hypothetical protein
VDANQVLVVATDTGIATKVSESVKLGVRMEAYNLLLSEASVLDLIQICFCKN